MCTVSASALMASASMWLMYTPASVRARLSATYACPVARMFASAMATASMDMPCALCTVMAAAASSGQHHAPTRTLCATVSSLSGSGTSTPKNCGATTVCTPLSKRTMGAHVLAAAHAAWRWRNTASGTPSSPSSDGVTRHGTVSSVAAGTLGTVADATTSCGSWSCTGRRTAPCTGGCAANASAWRVPYALSALRNVESACSTPPGVSTARQWLRA